MADDSLIQIELLPEERDLLLKYGYPFEEEREQLLKQAGETGVAILLIKPSYLGLMIGDLCHSINKRTRGRVQLALNELCERLEYVERTGDGELEPF